MPAQVCFRLPMRLPREDEKVHWNTRPSVTLGSACSLTQRHSPQEEITHAIRGGNIILFFTLPPIGAGFARPLRLKFNYLCPAVSAATDPATDRPFAIAATSRPC